MESIQFTEAVFCSGGGHLHVTAKVDGVEFREVLERDDILDARPHVGERTVKRRIAAAAARLIREAGARTRPQILSAVASKTIEVD